MTPAEMLALIDASAQRSTICGIERSCLPTPRCSRGSAYPVVEFDSKARKFYKERGETSKSSVDALAINPAGDKLLLVEIKSWQLAIVHPKSLEIIDPDAIAPIATKYINKLAKKVKESYELFQTLSGDPKVMDSLATAVIFVSDLPTDPVTMLAANLNTLAAFPTEYTQRCNDLTRLELGKLPDMETYYAGCHEFDALVAQL